MFTVLLRPHIPASRASMLTHLAAASVKEAVELSFPDIVCEIKKPNDLLINGKKVCGILVESSTRQDVVEYAVAGVGLNVLSCPEKALMNATSINKETKRKIEKIRLFDRILSQFALKYLNFVKYSVSSNGFANKCHCIT